MRLCVVDEALWLRFSLHIAHFLVSPPQALSSSGTLRLCGVSLMRYLGSLDHTDLSRDPVAPKNLAAFLTEVSELAPKLALGNISLLLEHLNGEVCAV